LGPRFGDGALIPQQVVIKAGHGGGEIRHDPQKPDAHRQGPQQEPAEKTQEEAEQFPAVAVHQRFASPQGFQAFQFGIFRYQKKGQSIGQGGHDSGDDQQQGPEKNE
jgi:hypothetical protein